MSDEPIIHATTSWQRIEFPDHPSGSPPSHIWRLRVPGGWLVTLRAVNAGDFTTMTFVPDEKGSGLGSWEP